MRGVRQKALYAPPGRARRSATAAAVLLLAVAASAPAGTLPVWVVPGVARLAPLAPPPVVPGEYAVLAFSVENLTNTPVIWTACLGVPPDWSVVTRERSASLEPGSAMVVPFSVWVGAHATPDQHHACRLALIDAAGQRLTVATIYVSVARRHELALVAPDVPVPARPGESVAHVFRLTNRGNGTDTLALRVTSVPSWPTAIPVTSLVMAPAESREITLTVTIPAEARDGTRHVVGLAVSASGERPEGPADASRGALATAQAVTQVAPPTLEPSRYVWLPAELAVSAERTELGDTVYGLRFGTAGVVGGETDVELSVDLLSEPRNAAERGWQNQRWRVGASGDRWEAAAGDVQKRSSGLAVRSLWGRGLQLRRTQGPLSVSAYAIRDRASNVQRSFGCDLEQQLGRTLRLRSEILRRRIEATPWRPEGWRDLVCVGLEGAPATGVHLGVEGGWSRSPALAGALAGTALQLTSSYRDPVVSADLRCFTGTDGYQGWNQDRDGVAGFVRYLPHLGDSSSDAAQPLALWLSLDAYQGRPTEGDSVATCRSDRSRAGGRFSWARGPVMELSAGHRHERDRVPEGRDHEWRDMGLSAWQTFGTLMLAGSGRWGRAYDRRSTQSGELTGLVLSLGGRLLGIQATARWSQDWAWLPELDEKSVTAAQGGEFSWASRHQRLKLALGASHQTQRFPGSERAARKEWVLRPRAEWRIVRDLAIQGEWTTRSTDAAFETDRVRVQLTWARQQALPVFWEPESGQLSGIVFLDEDGDGQPDPGESPVEGAVFVLGGEQRMSGADGSFAFPSCAPGIHELDLQPHSLPPGRAATGLWPRLITIQPGDEVRIAIPLTRSGGLSGRVFRDHGHDGHMDPEDEPLTDVRVLLRRAGAKVTESLTDAEGGYHFPSLTPGDYVVELDPAWMPAGWVPTVPLPQRAVVAPGDEGRVVPLGIAPRPRPVIRTFSASSLDQPLSPIDAP